MITCTNVQRITGLNFGSYLLLPQYSHSYLKRENNGLYTPIKATDKMQLGSLVDNILTGGEVDMNNKLYPAAKSIAHFIFKEFGWALASMEKQVTYTAMMQYNGFELPIKGRPDFEQQKTFILDLKVTSDPPNKIDQNINFMGYPNQQFGYAKQAEVSIAYILIYSRPAKECFLRSLKIGGRNSFWEEKILKFGKLIKK